MKKKGGLKPTSKREEVFMVSDIKTNSKRGVAFKPW